MAKPTISELTARLGTLEKALLRSERLALASRYVGAIMHEVNNPLEALSNLVYLAKNASDDSSQVIQYMETADAQLLRLGEITHKMLSFYKDQSEAKDFDLVDILDSVFTLHLQRTQLQNIEVRRQVQGPAMARIFAGEILQVFSNLILNALDAAPTSNAVLCVCLKTCEENIVITFADNGTGIDDSVYKTLFQDLRTTKSQGTGLRLWLSHNIILKHHGAIRCRSTRRPGRSGTTFRISLPLVAHA